MAAVLHILSIVAGAGTVLAVGLSVMRTLIVPRGIRSRLAWAIDSVTRRTIVGISRRLRSYEARDQLLTYEGPLRVLGLLFGWLLLALTGYALIFLPFVDSWRSAFLHSGSAMFTLGIAPGGGAVPAAVSLSAAATGLILVALQISYLPTLYSSFNRRETLVSMLSSRAGEPAWGPEILARLQLVKNTGDLHHFYREWESWAADVAESHTNYPVLLAFRSPRPLRSWLVGLLAVLDSAALYLALCPASAPGDARLFMRMGYLCLREIAGVLNLPFDDDPLPSDPISLSLDEFTAAVQSLEDVGFPIERSIADAWPHFRGWRVNYEAVVYQLADRLSAPPAPWSGTRRGLPGIVYPPRRPAHREPELPLSEPIGPPGETLSARP